MTTDHKLTAIRVKEHVRDTKRAQREKGIPSILTSKVTRTGWEIRVRPK